MIPADLTRDELRTAWQRSRYRAAGISFYAALADPLLALALRCLATHLRRRQPAPSTLALEP